MQGQRGKLNLPPALDIPYSTFVTPARAVHSYSRAEPDRIGPDPRHVCSEVIPIIVNGAYSQVTVARIAAFVHKQFKKERDPSQK